jgi:GDSL-like Lipase/Acylhydrolase
MLSHGNFHALLAVGFPLAGVATTKAAHVTIVALGTSNTAGRGLPSSQSYPSQLQAMLRAKAYDVSVINKGVNGDTTVGMLARVGSVPSGTRLVLFEYARPNEARATLAIPQRIWRQSKVRWRGAASRASRSRNIFGSRFDAEVFPAA